MNLTLLSNDEYQYLIGYFSSISEDSDLSDGAWFQMHIDSIEFLQEGEDRCGTTPDFRGRDAHEVVMEFMTRKALYEKQEAGSGNTPTP